MRLSFFLLLTVALFSGCKFLQIDHTPNGHHWAVEFTEYETISPCEVELLLTATGLTMSDADSLLEYLSEYEYTPYGVSDVLLTISSSTPRNATAYQVIAIDNDSTWLWNLQDQTLLLESSIPQDDYIRHYVDTSGTVTLLKTVQSVEELQSVSELQWFNVGSPFNLPGPCSHSSRPYTVEALTDSTTLIGTWFESYVWDTNPTAEVWEFTYGPANQRGGTYTLETATTTSYFSGGGQCSGSRGTFLIPALCNHQN